MADEILSEDELGALLDSIEEGPGQRRERRVVDFDFARPDKLGPLQVQVLQRLYEGVAEAVSQALSLLLRLPVQVDLISLGQLGFEVYRDSLPAPLVLQVLDMQPGRADALLSLDPRVALGMVDRLLGGSGRSLDEARALTLVEHRLVENATGRFLDRLAAAWSRYLELGFSVRSRESDPQGIQGIPGGEMVLVASFSIHAGQALEAGELGICIPFINLESCLMSMGAPDRFIDQRRDPSAGQREHLRRTVGDTTLEIRAALGGATLSIDQILAMQVGDVVMLDTRCEAPITASVGRLSRLRCRPGRIGRKLGLLVEELLLDSKEDDRG